MLKPTESRMAAIGLLLMAWVLAYLLLLHWWFVAPLLHLNARMDQLRLTQARYAAVIGQQPQLQQRLASLARHQSDNLAFLPDSDPSVAAAGLMQRVVDDVSSQTHYGHCEVTRKQIPPPSSTSDNKQFYQRVSVDISLNCRIRPLVGLLYQLEKKVPYLFMSRFTIYRSFSSKRRGHDSGVLRVQFKLYGYVRPKPATSNQIAVGDAR